MMYEHLNEL